MTTTALAELTGADLLFALAERLDSDGIRETHPDDRVEQEAVRDILAAAGRDVAAGRDSELTRAVLVFARHGALYVDEEG